jgi:hypothetical protein
MPAGSRPWTPATASRLVGAPHEFGEGEQRLSDWMASNALVSWVVREQPWGLEDELIGELDLPLNLKGNKRHVFHQTLTQARADCLEPARQRS